MDRIPRILKQRILDYLKPGYRAESSHGRAALLFGVRRTGKTFLISQILDEFPEKGDSREMLLLNGEDYDAQVLLEPCSIANYKRLLEGVRLFALDEAQNIPNIGQKLKLMVDELPDIRIIASGSSSFDLLNQAGAPLVGRSASFYLTPFSQKELAPYENPLETRQRLDDRLIYGSYPEVALMEGSKQKEEYLKEIVNAYLFKDILALDGLKSSSKIRDLCRLISFQMGNEVVYDELGKQLGMSKNTVEKYLDLLSKVFVIYRLGAYSHNLRKEVTKAGKWYFYDTGIRNAVIGNFSLPNLRQDMGALWENYLINERIKNRFNTGQSSEFYFWRTYDGQEIDFIEELTAESGKGGAALTAYEFKRGKKQPKVPAAFAEAYPDAKYLVINRDNYLELV
jgi:predicted AAA+ superfamily ATPase